MAIAGDLMSDYIVKPLGPETWDAFERLGERHNGVWGGCWCTWFHTFYAEKEKGRTSDSNRALKERLVNEGRAHAALVFDGDEAVAWCQYGTPAELPNINHRKEYEAALDKLPDYRLTCFFVDRKSRRRGLAGVALNGALHLIARPAGSSKRTHRTPTARRYRHPSSTAPPGAFSRRRASATSEARARTTA